MRSEKRYAAPHHCVEYFDIGEDPPLAVHELSANGHAPTLTLLGGVHGDEPEGVMAIRQLFNQLAGATISGTIRAVPVANPIAFAHGSRTTPIDGLNLARVFPGDAQGSVTSRIAHVISTHVIAGSDLLIDLHSAGTGLEMPLFCGYRAVNSATVTTSAEAARAFGCPLVWAHDQAAPGRSLSVADDLNIPALYVESRGGGQVRHDDLEAYVAGVMRVMGWMGIIEDYRPAPIQQERIPGGHGNVDSGLVAPADGLLVTLVSAGDRVSAGTPLMHIYGQDGPLHNVIHAPNDGIVMLVRRTIKVREGETICLLAPSPEVWTADDQVAATG
jgi:uncharacterized protein